MRTILVVIGSIMFQGVAMKAQTPEIIICQDMEKDSLLFSEGYRYIVESIAKNVSPRNVSEQQFMEKLQSIKNLRTKIYALNIFLPGDLKVIGPSVDEAGILAYTDIVFQRCQAAEIKLIIWGSSGSRRLPDGFDKTMAKAQFVSIAKKVSAQAKKYNITLALENLNTTETNFITTFEEALDIVQRVDHPNFRVCVDIYHMLKENEPAGIIMKASKYIIHCNIAEKENRAPPGTKGDDFTPYLRALKQINYKGKIALECRWEDVNVQAGTAKVYLQREIDKVWD